MASLPTEIIMEEILPKLPAKSLQNFKCVSKSFNTFISSPEFIDLHLRQSLSSDANRLLLIPGTSNHILYSIDVNSLDSATTTNKIPLHNSTLGLCRWLNQDPPISILGSFNGLLCLRLCFNFCGYGSFKLVLINPSTGVYREIDHFNPCWEQTLQNISVGFGFDDMNHDYKLVRISKMPYLEREVMVYSLNEDSWKLVEDVCAPSDSLQRNHHGHGVLMKNHLLHWVFRGSSKFRIGCFNVQSNKWANDVPLMELFTHPMGDFDEEDNDKVVRVLHLGVLHGCLCLTAVTNLTEIVWIMKEYGVKDSWVKMFDISHSIDPRHFHIFGPLTLRRGSKRKILVKGKGKTELFWCDIVSGNYTMIEELEIKGINSFEGACSFKESLVPIPGGQQIERLKY